MVAPPGPRGAPHLHLLLRRLLPPAPTTAAQRRRRRRAGTAQRGCPHRQQTAVSLAAGRAGRCVRCRPPRARLALRDGLGLRGAEPGGVIVRLLRWVTPPGPRGSASGFGAVRPPPPCVGWGQRARAPRCWNGCWNKAPESTLLCAEWRPTAVREGTPPGPADLQRGGGGGGGGGAANPPSQPKQRGASVSLLRCTSLDGGCAGHGGGANMLGHRRCGEAGSACLGQRAAGPTGGPPRARVAAAAAGAPWPRRRPPTRPLAATAAKPTAAAGRRRPPAAAAASAAGRAGPAYCCPGCARRSQPTSVAFASGGRAGSPSGARTDGRPGARSSLD